MLALFDHVHKIQTAEDFKGHPQRLCIFEGVQKENEKKDLYIYIYIKKKMCEVAFLKDAEWKQSVR